MKRTKRRPGNTAKRTADRTTNRVQRLAHAGMNLPEGERRKLVELLADSLPEPAVPQAAVDGAWNAEIQRRIDEIETGQVTLVPWDRVHQRLRRIARGHAPRKNAPRGRGRSR